MSRRIVLTTACSAALLLVAAGHAAPAPQATERIDFGRDIRPLLADRCFRCHGPDEGARKRGLRLDTSAGARSELASSSRAIVPGDLDASELVRRIRSTDPDEVMPPPALGRPLSAPEQALLARWVEQGAEYAPHWAFVPPIAVPAPAVRDAAWCRDELDRFVLSRLEAEGLAPAPEADRPTLLRRAALVLTGLPPTPVETLAFEHDPSPRAYEAEVDRLLASPRHAERMAADWLDVARFADTFGYQSDWDCHTWPWRDWLISAFDRDLPYDRFVRDQLAGDLVPGATRDEQIATAFNRLHRMTNEGGSIDEEFRQEYVSDRIGTASTAFLGLTAECARCHDHKYDPIPQRDYYSLGAFFGSIDESGTYAYSHAATPPPALRLSTPDEDRELARCSEELQRREIERDAETRAARAAARAWSRLAPRVLVAPPIVHAPLDGDIDGPSGRATALDGDRGPELRDVRPFTRSDAYSVVLWVRCPDTKRRATVFHTAPFTIESDQQGHQLMLEDGRLAWQVLHFWPGSAAAVRTLEPFPLERWVEVAVTYDGSSRAAGLHVFLDGVEAETEVVRDHLDGVATARTFQIGFRDRDLGFQGGAVDELRVFDRALTRAEVHALHAPLGVVPNELFEEHYLAAVDPGCLAAGRAVRSARRELWDRHDGLRSIMVMRDAPRVREHFVLARGAYDRPDSARPVRTDRALEGVLPFGAERPKNRLGLAGWMTDARNPLTARVQVNRLWAQCFGRGIVATQENFGLQGGSPSHPELLDRLAVAFREGGWSNKALLRRLVLCSTFRQSSRAVPELLARDPDNVLLARGPSFRLSAEMLRDQALHAAGLLVERIGGPSVKPWQPPGLWEESGATGSYAPDHGEGAHRRSLYTFRKRTAPPPNLLAFDAGSRETCLARRASTNTPLQPLVLLNDPVFFECAQALARVAADGVGDTGARIERAFQRLAARAPRPGELEALDELHRSELAAYQADPEAARTVNGGSSADAGLAALTLLCSTLLAADATVTCR